MVCHININILQQGCTPQGPEIHGILGPRFFDRGPYDISSGPKVLGLMLLRSQDHRSLGHKMTGT